MTDPRENPEASQAEADEDLVIVRNATEEFQMAERMLREKAERLAKEGPPPPPPAPTPPPPPKLEREPEPEPEPEPETNEGAPEAANDAPAESAEDSIWLDPVAPAPTEEVAAVKAARATARRREPPVGSLLAAVVGLGMLAGATALSAWKLEPVHTWYYVFAWYPFLALVNYATSVRSRAHSVFLGRGRQMLGLLAWSVPVWLVFELFNLRVQNWYYTSVPQELVARRLGVILSFATVLPGVLLFEELLWVRRAFVRARTKPFPWKPGWDRVLLATGAIFTALVLVFPSAFFPLVWGVPVLLLEPWLRRGGGPSLTLDLSEGRPGRIYRLLLAGMACGLWWEAANTFAGGKWIYTVPGLGPLAPLEMPAIGFIGFAPFALCLWTMARALVRLGLLPDWGRVGEARHPSPPPLLSKGRKRAMAGAVVFTFAMLAAMDRWTVDSFTARAADVPGVPDGVPEYARQKRLDDVRGVLQLVESGELYVPGGSTQRILAQLGHTCRLALLRGIGTDNARRLLEAGVMSVHELALQEPEALTERLAAIDEPGWSPVERRVAVWIRAAKQETGAR